MGKDRKETLSPTLVQTLTNSKSPLTAFGEGLMKVGETNQKIHDTIWEHDLRQERLERERALHDMQVEAHELKMRRENFQQGLDEEFGRGDRELAQKAQKAGIANTWENTRGNRERINRQLYENSINDMMREIVGQDFLDKAGNSAESYNAIMNVLEATAADESKTREERESAMDTMSRLRQVRGYLKLNSPEQTPEWDERETQALLKLGVSPHVVTKKAGGGHSWSIADSQIKANFNELPFMMNNLEKYSELENGDKALQDFDVSFQRDFKNSAYRIAQYSGWNKDAHIAKMRTNLATTNTFLGEALKDFKAALNTTGVYDNQIRKIKDYTTGNSISGKALQALYELRTAAMTKMYFGGNASNKDLEVIKKVAPNVNHNDIQSIHLLNLFVKSEISNLEMETSLSPLQTYAKYGDEYANLKSLSVLLDALIENKNSDVEGTSDNLTQFQPKEGK